MCNIAGYVGSKRAAPILIEMMRAQEGWGGGYYSGIATIHEEKIHYAKLTGNMDRLTAETEAANLPGQIGIIHSRSKSGGGDRWAHPFIAGKDGSESAAYVANGSYGWFADRTEEAGRIAASLVRDGYALTSRETGAIGRYPQLGDGSCAHMSDVMAQLIARKIDEGLDACSAMNEAFCRMPSEIVGLLLSLTEPDCIVFSRVNQPMNVSFAPHGAYLATAALAFPKDAGERYMLPALSGGRVYRDHFTAGPYKNAPGTVAPVTAKVAAEAYAAIVSLMKTGEQSVGQLCRQITPLFDEADCVPAAILVYHVLDSLNLQGRLETAASRAEGAAEGMSAPVFRAKIKDL